MSVILFFTQLNMPWWKSQCSFFIQLLYCRWSPQSYDTGEDEHIWQRLTGVNYMHIYSTHPELHKRKTKMCTACCRVTTNNNTKRHIYMVLPTMRIYFYTACKEHGWGCETIALGWKQSLSPMHPWTILINWRHQLPCCQLASQA